MNEGFETGIMSITQREGIITCIPKGDKPREFLKNWRPISLLNVIYKIGSSCIANRIKGVLPELINEDQTGFVPGRYIGDNLRLLYDIMHYLKDENLPNLQKLVSLIGDTHPNFIQNVAISNYKNLNVLLLQTVQLQK